YLLPGDFYLKACTGQHCGHFFSVWQPFPWNLPQHCCFNYLGRSCLCHQPQGDFLHCYFTSELEVDALLIR
uniref:Uncharacterized protein n=1 Tax=Myripristis murdjan TaxID=586833 RepID=A0A667WKH2_9TELE